MARSLNIDNSFIANDLVREVCNARYSTLEVEEIVKNLSLKADLIVLDNPILQAEIAKACSKISEYYDYKEGIATSKYLRGKTSTVNGNNEEAIELLKEALTFFEVSNNKEEIAKISYSLSNAYKGLLQYDISLKYLFRSLKYYETYNNKVQLAKINFNIATAFFNLNNFSESLIYFHKALANSRENKDTQHLAYCILNIGIIYQNLEQLSLANQYYSEVFTITKDICDAKLDGMVFFHKATLYEALKNYPTAKAYYLKALEQRKKCSSKEGVARCYFNLGLLCIKTNDFLTGKKYLFLAYFSFNELRNLLEMANCCKAITQLFEKIEDYKSALKFEREHNELLRKIFEKESQNLTGSLFQKESNKNEVQIIEFNKEEVLLNQKNKQLREFAGIVSHDLNEPLRSVVSFTRQLKRKLNKKEFDESTSEFMSFIEDAGIRMSLMLKDLKEYAILGIDEHEKQSCDLNEVLEVVRRNLFIKILENKTNLKIPMGLPVVHSSFTKLVQLFQNLITNSIKFRKKDGINNVEITFNETDETIILGVKDNGIGMDEDSQTLIFNIFKRLNPNSNIEGTGIGLAICQQIISELDGKIYVKSKPNEGSTFFVELPKQIIVKMAATA